MSQGYPRIYLYRRIVQAKLFIDKFYHEPIDLNNVSGEAAFSKFHFIRLFKSVYGKTPHQYLTAVRIENARVLLQNNHMISHVCYSVGFESITSFTSLFKRMTGLNPSQYQRQQLLRKKEMADMPLKFIPNCFAENKGWIKNSNFQEEPG